MGYVPDWLNLIEAARYLHVPPWELMKQPTCWRDWALMAQEAVQKIESEKGK